MISVGFVPQDLKCDYIFISNTRRYTKLKNENNYENYNKIVTSNIKQNKSNEKENIVTFTDLVNPGNEHIDNSTILLLYLLNKINVNSIGIAGLDGYSYAPNNYATSDLELSNVLDSPDHINFLISNMLLDFFKKKSIDNVFFVTTSQFENILENNQQTKKEKGMRL